jgi:RNA polymerase sigma factor (sigma-70 family)
VDERDVLAQRFEENRTRLRAVAYRMPGSRHEAEDAVQEAWLRLSRSDSTGIGNLGGWLTTVVGRVCLDMLRSRKARREDPADIDGPGGITLPDDAANPERDANIADSVGLALLVVLETLAPAERVAFVLHDMFDLPFDEIASIVGRTPDAARQLASRARRRVQGTSTATDADRERKREVVDAFLAAARGGDFNALLAVLDPDVVVRADSAAIKLGAAAEIRGAAAVAERFVTRARAAQPAIVGGAPGVVWAPGGTPRVAFNFTVADGRIAGIDLIGDPEHIRQLDVVIID